MAKVLGFDDPRLFLERAEPFLLQNEPAHNLLLGIAHELTRRSEQPDCSPYLAVLADDAATSGVALRTPPFNLVISQLENHVALPLLARDVHARYTTVPGVLGPSTVAKAFCRAWHDVSGQESRLAVALRVFRLNAVRHVPGVSGLARRASAKDRGVLIAWFAAFHAEALAVVRREVAAREVDAFLTDETQYLYVWEDEGHLVAVAGARGRTAYGSARSTRLPSAVARASPRRSSPRSAKQCLISATSSVHSSKYRTLPGIPTRPTIQCLAMPQGR